MASGGGSGDGGGRRSVLLLAWEVSADQEEPWRRLLQELSDAPRKEGYVRSRRRLGVSAESVWLVPKPTGGGLAVVCLEALEDPERAPGELAATETPFETYYSAGMGKLLGFDLARLARAASGEPLFAWRDDARRGER